MNEAIKVYIVKYTDRKNYMLRYECPATGKQIAKSSGTHLKQKAERLAGKWEDDLRNGRYKKNSSMGWNDFREYLEDHHLDGMAKNTFDAYQSSLNVFENECRPKKLADMTTKRITALGTALRKNGRAPATVARHYRHLKAVANWAHKQGLLSVVPEFSMPKLQKGMRGRPIATEEFERMLSKAGDVMGEKAVGSWRFYLQGLWASGLRLEESLTLRWDSAPGCIVVDFTGKFPMLLIPAEAEKGNSNRLLPITPEFAEHLAKVPENQRKGFVFRPLTKPGEPIARTRHAVGPHIAAIGEAAGVVTDRKIKRKVEVLSYAGAHDLRRSFGFRWSRKLMPAELRELMRHESVETTMKYYVGVNADVTAQKLWDQQGNTFGNSGQKTAIATAEKSLQTL